MHKSCSLMVQVRWFASADEAKRVCYQWIAAATHESENQHWNSAERILAEHRVGKVGSFDSSNASFNKQ